MNLEQVLVRSIVLCAAVSLTACGGSGGDAGEGSGDGGSSGSSGSGAGGSGEGGEGDQGGSGGSGGSDGDAGGTAGGSSGGSSGTSGGAGGASSGSASDSGGSTSDSGGSTSDSGGSTSGSGGSTTGSGGSTTGSGGSTTATTGSGNGSVPEELIGVWQGISVVLKISSDGAYYFAQLSTGESSTCAEINYFEQSVGVAVLDGDSLTLLPDEHRLDVTDCEETNSQVFENDPIPFTISLEETRHYYGGLRSYRMHVEGGAVPLDLTLLHRPPTDDPVQPEQPSDFVLGETGPFEDFQGLWVPADGTDSDFFDSSTGEFYFPELNGSPHQWIRFYGNAYETAVALQNINSEGSCKADLIYYEQGVGLFQVTEDVGGQGNHFVGHGRLEATAARLIVNVRECEESDAVYQYNVDPLMSYYRFIYFSPDAPPERLSLDCAMFPQSEWLSMLCTNDVTSYYRRE